MANDKMLGSAIVDLTKIEPREPKDLMLPLMDAPGATIHIRLNFTPGFINFIMRHATTMSSLTNVVNPMAQMKTVGYLGKSAVGGVGKLAGGVAGGAKSIFVKKKKEEEVEEMVIKRVPTHDTDKSASIMTEGTAIPEIVTTSETSHRTLFCKWR